MSAERTIESRNTTSEPTRSMDVIGWAGIGFAVLAGCLYGLLFFMLTDLPSSRNEIEQLRTNAPALTRLLVVAASGAILNVVALILCLSGLLAPRQHRTISVIGAVLSAIMLFGVFSVVIVSLMIAPR